MTPSQSLKSICSNIEARDAHSSGIQPYRRLPNRKSISHLRQMRCDSSHQSHLVHPPQKPHNGSRNLSPQCQNPLPPRPLLLLLYTYAPPLPSTNLNQTRPPKDYLQTDTPHRFLGSSIQFRHPHRRRPGHAKGSSYVRHPSHYNFPLGGSNC